jgi:ribosomal protein L10
VNISSRKIPNGSFHPGEVYTVKKSLMYKAMKYTAFIRPLSENFNEAEIKKPLSPNTYIAIIKPGDQMKIVKVTEDLLPNSVGGITTTARILDGELAGKEGIIRGFKKIDGFATPDPEYFKITPR